MNFTDHEAFNKALSRCERYKTVVIVGSSPQAPIVNRLIGPETIIIALNNSWRALDRYDFLVYSDDFPDINKPGRDVLAIRGRSSPQYLPAMNSMGSLDLCGPTIAMAAGYWAIANFPFSQISFFACDMVYSGVNTHFYGRGEADPLRRDPTLQDLTAKSLRLFYYGFMNSCLFLNASGQDNTRLGFPRERTGTVIRHNILENILPELEKQISHIISVSGAARVLEGLPYSNIWEHFKLINDAWRLLLPVSSSIEDIVNRAISSD